MTDSSAEQPAASNHECPKAPKAPHPNFQYPQLLLETSFDSLLAHSYPQNQPRPVNMVTSQRGPSSLSESWASISDFDSSHDEDIESEHTDVGSLIDLHSTDDAHSIREEDLDSEAEPGHDVEQSEVQELQASQLKNSQHTQHISASLFEADGSESPQITLEEPENAADDVLVKHTLRVFANNDLTDAGYELPKEASDNGFVGTIHMPLSRYSISETGRQMFRILFFAPQSSSTQDLVVGKIADALVAAGSRTDFSAPRAPTSYHIVPDSFGPGSKPGAAEIIPIGCQLDVDRYHSTIMGGLNGTNATLCNEADVKKTFSKWDERRQQYVINDGHWKQPDLAMIVVDDATSKEQYTSACDMLVFATRHHIPAIVVRAQSGWTGDYAPLVFSQSGVQLCIEARPLSQEFVLHRLPIDLDTFLNLNSGQLSRHIAYLLKRQEHKLDFDVDQPPSKRKVLADMEKEDKLGKEQLATYFRQLQTPPDFQKRFSRTERIAYSAITFVGSFILLYLFGTLLMRGLVAVTTSTNDGQLMASAKRSTISVSSSTTTHVMPIASVSSAIPEVADLPNVKPVPLTLGSAKPASGKYEVELVGTSHLVVKVPNRVKAGEINIEVFKKGVPVHAEVSKLFPSVYSVRIIPEHAFGEVVVKITARRAQLVETIPVSMGDQPMDVWFKSLVHETEENLRQQLAMVQRSIEELRYPKRPRVKKLRKAFQDWSTKTSRSIREYNWETPRDQLTYKLRKHQAALAKQIDQQSDTTRARLADVTRLSSRQGKAFAEQLARQMSKVYDAFDSAHFRDNLDKFSRSLQENAQSETLATAQERAQQVVKEARRKWNARGRRR